MPTLIGWQEMTLIGEMMKLTGEYRDGMASTHLWIFQENKIYQEYANTEFQMGGIRSPFSHQKVILYQKEKVMLFLQGSQPYYGGLHAIRKLLRVLSRGTICLNTWNEGNGKKNIGMLERWNICTLLPTLEGLPKKTSHLKILWKERLSRC